MFKTITHLPMRIATLLMLVVMFATGMTASAEHFHVDFKQPNATSFTDGDLLVTSDDLASTLEGLVLNSSTTVTFQTDRPGLEGIGRIVFNAAPGTNNDDLELLASSCGFSFHRGQFTASGSHLIVTPSSTEELRNRAEVNLVYSRLVMGSRRVVFESVDVYTGVLASNSSPEEYTTEGYTMTGVLNCFDAFSRAKNAPGSNWTATSFGVDEALLANYYYRNADAPVPVALYVAHEGGIRFYNNCLILCRDAQFTICAPAGYAIKSIRFVSVDLNVLYCDFGWGTQDLSCIKSNSGRMSGTMDRIWTADAGSAEAGSVQFYVNDDSSPYIDHIVATMEPIACGASSTDTRFNVTADMTWPRGHAEVIHGGYENPSFWYTVHPADGITFTSVAEAPEVKMTLDNGSVLYPATTGGLYEGNAVFTFTLPEDLVRRPFGATFEFPEGVISAGADHNRAFSRHLHVRPTAFYDVTGVMTSDPSANPFELYGYTDVDLYGDRNNTPGTYSQFQFYFTGYTQALGELSWTYGEPLAPSDVIFTDADGGRLDIASVELGTDASGHYCLTVTLRQPITESNMGRYRLTIPEGVVITKNGYTNRRIDVGYNFYVSDSEPLSTIPAQNSWVKSLGKVIYYLPSRSLQLDEEQVEVDYALGGEWQTMTVTASIDEQGRGVLTFPQPITASDIANFVMSGMKGNPFLVDGKRPVYPSVTCRFDPGMRTYDHGYLDPSASRMAAIEDFRESFTTYNDVPGFFISYKGTAQLVDRNGLSLNHGDRIWDAANDVSLQGFRFIRSSADEYDMSSFMWGDAICINEDGKHGVFFPSPDIFPGKYHLYVPAGLINLVGPYDGAPRGGNDVIDITWEVGNCGLRTETWFDYKYPTEKTTYRSIDKFVIEPRSSYGVDWTGIIEFDEHPTVYVFDGSNNTKHTVTGAYDNDGRVVYTFDEPIVGTGHYTITLYAGAICNSHGIHSRDMSVSFDLDSNIEALANVYTEPKTGLVPNQDVANPDIQLDADRRAGFFIQYPEPLTDAQGNAIQHGTSLLRFTQQQPGLVWERIYGEPGTESCDHADNELTQIFAYNDDTEHGLFVWIADNYVESGVAYHLALPEGLLHFGADKINAAGDFTWNVVDATSPDAFYLSDPYPNGCVYRPFSKFTIAPSQMMSHVVTIESVISEPVDILIQYTDPEGIPHGQTIPATVALDAQGRAVFTLAELFTPVVIARDVKMRIPTGTITCTDGLVNAEFWTADNLWVEKPYMFWIQGTTEPMQQMPTNSISEITITCYDETLVEVGSNATIRVEATLTGEKMPFVSGDYTPKAVSLGTNADGRSVLTVVLPDDVAAAINSQSGRCEVRVTLSGYTETEHAAGQESQGYFVKNAAGLPNAPTEFFFIINPALQNGYIIQLVNFTDGFTKISVGDRDFTLADFNENYTLNEEFASGQRFKPEDVKVYDANGEYPANVYVYSRDYEYQENWEFYDIVIDFTRYANVAYAFPEGDTFEQGDFSLNCWGIGFDKTVAQDFVGPNKYDGTGQTFVYQLCEDGSQEPIDLLWSSAHKDGEVFTLGFESPLPAGLYMFRLPAGLITFTDGSTNPTYQRIITVTESTKFEFLGVGSFATPFIAGSNFIEDLPANVSVCAMYDPNIRMAQGEYANGMELPVRFSSEANPEVVERNAIVYFYMLGEEPDNYRLVRFDFLDPAGALIPFDLGLNYITIPEGTFVTNDGLKNREFTIMANVVDPDVYTVKVTVNGVLTDNVAFNAYNEEGDLMGTYYTGDRINIASIDLIDDPDDEDCIAFLPAAGDIVTYDQNTRTITINYTFNPVSAILDHIDVDGEGGLRAATLVFRAPISAEFIPRRIQWSEGFKLQRKQALTNVTLDTDIDYVTTTASADGTTVTFRFFSADGRELFPLQKGDYFLYVPTSVLEPYGVRLYSGCGHTINVNSAVTWIRTSFTVTQTQIKTAIPEINEAPEYQDAAGQADLLASIIIGELDSGARTNDIDGNGDISIGDLVQLIDQYNQSEAAYDEPITIWTGNEAFVEGTESVYIGADGGTELIANGAKPGTLVTFYVQPIELTYLGWFIINDGHWQASGNYAEESDWDSTTGTITFELTQEMIDLATTEQQFWGGTFVAMGQNWRLTKVTLTNRKPKTTGPRETPIDDNGIPAL